MPESLDKVQAVLDFLERAGDAPWDMGALHLARDGRLLRRDGATPLRFGFRGLGVPVAARLERDGAAFRLSLQAALGHVPFTGEAASARRRMLERVRAAAGILATDGRAITAEAELRVESPLTPERLVAALAGFVLTLKPEIEALAPCLPAPRAARGIAA